MFKRLKDFVSINELKSDFITLLETTYNNFGLDTVQGVLEALTDRQLESISDAIPEAKEMLTERKDAKEREKATQREERK